MASPAATTRVQRLFFALWPDEATREALRKATRALARHSGGKPVPAASFHLTLAFLGNVPEERCAALVAAATPLALALAPLTLTLDRFGYFAAPQVLWIGPTADPEELRSFVAGLRRALAAAGAAPDLKPFHPHVSIARKVAAPPALEPPRPVAWPVSGFALVESETDPEGARYRVITAFPARG